MEILFSPKGKKYYILPSGYKQYLCSEEGCNRSKQGKGGKCYQHGNSYKKCQSYDCESWARSRSDFCRKHGAHKNTCVHDNCDNISYSQGFCGGHNPNIKLCTVRDCSTPARHQDKCHKHNPPKCIEEGCDTAPRKDGKCQNHLSEDFRKEYIRKLNEYYKNRRNTDPTLRCMITVESEQKGFSKLERNIIHAIL